MCAERRYSIRPGRNSEILGIATIRVIRTISATINGRTPRKIRVSPIDGKLVDGGFSAGGTMPEMLLYLN